MTDLLKHGDCCAPCAQPLVVNTPGVKGDKGNPADNGANGVNAYTTLAGTFTMPAVDASSVASVGDSSWISPGQILFLQFAGYVEATGKPDNTSVTLKNLGYLGNTVAGTLIPVLSQLSPAGRQGPQAVADLTSLLDIKQSVRAATTADITLSGEQTIDGVALLSGDRVLVKEQTTAGQNGLYQVASGAWARTTDADTNAEVTAGLFVWVNEGALNSDTGWVLTTDDPIVLGTTNLTFTQFSGLVSVLGGNGIVISGDTIHFAQSGAYTAGAIPFASGAATIGFDAANFFWDDTNDRLGLLTNAPTHTITLGSTSTGFAQYGTADQVTNYQRMRISYTSDQFFLLAETGGAAAVPSANLVSSDAAFEQAMLSVWAGGVPLFTLFKELAVSATGDLFLADYEGNASSGTQTFFAIRPRIRQTGTAAYNALLVDVTETTTGSGAKRLLTLQVGASPKFQVDNTGDLITLKGVTYVWPAANATGVLTNNGSGTLSWAAVAAGTVTSVAISGPTIISWTGTPITTSGTLTGTLANQTANLILAGPTSGGAAAPTFRALVSADIPTTLTLNQLLFNSTALTYGATTNLDFNSTALQTVSLTGNVTFTTSNRGSGKSITLKILCDGTGRTLTFPAWIFVGTMPTAIAASKTGILTVTAFGANDTDCVAAYAEQA